MSIENNYKMLANIINEKLMSVSLSYETVSLVFENNWLLTIFSKMNLFIYNQNTEFGEVKLLAGKTLVDAVAANCRLILYFSEGYTIEIDLSENGYTGPEIMQLVGPNNQIIIWN